VAGARSFRGGTTWVVPLVVFAGTWEVVARLVQRPHLFPTLVDTLGHVPSLLTLSVGESILNSLVEVIVGFAN